MSQQDGFDRSLDRWFDGEAQPTGTADVLDRALGVTRQRRPRPSLFAGLGSRWGGDSISPTAGLATLGRTDVRTSMALLLLLLLALMAGVALVGARLLQPAPVGLGIFEPISGWIVYGNDDGIWGDNPDGPDVKLTSGAGTPLEWSRDGTRLLVAEGEHLFVLHADGSETQLTSGWFRTGAATISPDGTRVVFEGKNAAESGPISPDRTRALVATDSGLFAVDVAGGPVEMLLEVGVEGVTFSPDGTQIAYVTGHGDSSHRVSIMDADGTSAREVLANDITLGGGHDHGLAWSPAGDRIALGIGGTFYTFAPDGSGFAVALDAGGRVQPFWSPDGSHLETRGPRHPGTLETSS